VRNVKLSPLVNLGKGDNQIEILFFWLNRKAIKLVIDPVTITVGLHSSGTFVIIPFPVK
jgi:hypothetical protein